jgi:hypothetical protein
MKPVLTIFSIILLTSIVCQQEKDKPVLAEYNFKNDTFIHLFFETEEDCINAQPDPNFFINCHRQVDFLENYRANIMLTDIIHIGQYKVEGNKIILSFDVNYEIPSGEIIFEILKKSLLRKLDDNTEWKKMTGDSIWD